jgi:hypothetical protein
MTQKKLRGKTQRQIMYTFQVEAQDRAEKLARVTAEEAAAKKLQDDRVEQAAAMSRGVNVKFFEQERLREEQAKANKPISKPKQTNEDAIAENTARYPFPKVNPQPVADHLADALVPDAARAGVTTVPKFVPKPSIALQPQPDPYPSNDPRHGMSEDLIRKMGLKP